MNAKEIAASCAPEKGLGVFVRALPSMKKWVAAAEPAPMKTRKAVPRNSAPSFCGVVGGAAMRVARGGPRPGGAPGASHLLRRDGVSLETCSTLPNDVSRNISLRRSGVKRETQKLLGRLRSGGAAL